jgi:nicotinamidase-related amidase
MARAILVIDVQKVYTDPTSPLHCMGNAAAIDNINAIVTRGRAAGDLIVQVRHLHRADGSDAGRMFDFTGDATEIGFVEGTTEAEDDPRLALEPASLTIHKQRYSCFVGTGLDDALRARRRYHRGHRIYDQFLLRNDGPARA